jgi:hypothetical protein
LAASAPEEAHAVAPEKYTMPPLVPATVKAGVVVGLAIDTIPPVHVAFVTVPLPPLDVPLLTHP